MTGTMVAPAKRKPHNSHIRKKDCHHFWLIQEPDGPTSEGICKYCGAKDTFFNYIPDLSAKQMVLSMDGHV